MSQNDTDSNLPEVVEEHSSEITNAAKVVGISVTAVAAYRSLEVLTVKLLTLRARRKAEKIVKDSTPPISGKV